MADFREISDSVSSALTASVSCAGRLPARAKGLALYRSRRAFDALLDAQADRLLALASSVFKRRAVKCAKLVGTGNSDLTELAERADAVAAANDVLLDRAGSHLDRAELEVRGKKPPPKPTSAGGAPNTLGRGARTMPEWLTVKSGSASRTEIPKPQAVYKLKVDTSNKPFKHLSPQKGKATAKGLKVVDESVSNDSSMDENEYRPDVLEAHPYSNAMANFDPDPVKHLSPVEKLSEPWDVENAPPEIVADVDKLTAMITVLKNVDVVAIDLEHHDQRSYLGLTCLIQISTRDRDFIVDPFPVWDHIQQLNTVFSSPKIVKVLHGCDRDVMWLQRDFKVYLCPPLFDTGRAARQLNFAKLSLDYTVSKLWPKCPPFNKSLALADWRMRPLPKELLDYARSDTHYLIYCYEKLKNMALECGGEELLRSVWMAGTRLCAQLYQKPVFNAYEACEKVLSKAQPHRRKMNTQQLFALKRLLAWRDQTGRAHDESTNFVLPNHMLVQMAAVLPADASGLLACCAPVPQLVRRRLAQVHRIILEARGQPLQPSDKTRLADFDRGTTGGGALQHTAGDDYASAPLLALMAPHDHSHTEGNEEFRPVYSLTAEKLRAAVDVTPLIAVLHCTDPSTSNDKVAVLETAAEKGAEPGEDFLSPHDKYQLAVYDRRKREEAEMKARKQKEKEQSKEDTGRYTHLDSSTGVGSKPVNYPSTVAPEPSKKPPEPIHFDDTELRPKEKVRKAQKHAKRQPDVAAFDYKTADRQFLRPASAGGKPAKRKSAEGQTGAGQKKKMRQGRSQLVKKGARSITYK